MLARSIFHRLNTMSSNVLLLGPRQVGKSTLVQSLKPDLSINLADENLFLAYSKDPGRLKREIANLSRTKGLIALDEIQRVPALLNTVQAILDADCHHRFILTGSSARKLRQRGVNLLPGRIVLEYLDPLSFWELGSLFDLEKVLQTGSLPGIYLNDKEGPEILSSYTTIYLREEIQAEAAARNIGSYARFLDIAAECSGQWCNYTKIANDSEIPKETIRRFFQILEDTLIVFRVPPFRSKRSHRRISQRDRFIFFDLGVRNAILGIHRQRLSPMEKGNLFEQWVLSQCISYMHAKKKEWKLSSYRTDAGVEVDIILDTGKKFLALECKSGKNVAQSQTRGLRSFETVAGKPVDKVIVYQGDTRQKFSGGEIVLPYKDFFSEILPSI